jgi:hypothetical protein
MRDGISLREFSRDTQDGLKALCLRYELWELDTQLPEWWAALAFILRQAPDDPEFFPKGKWATIQQIERRLDEWANDRLQHH